MLFIVVCVLFVYMFGLVLIGWVMLVQVVFQVVSVELLGKVLKVSLLLDGGMVCYWVECLGDIVVEDLKFGFVLCDGCLDCDFILLGQQWYSVDDIWEQFWGECWFICNYFNELIVQLVEIIGSKWWLDVVFCVYDDGFGFCYVFFE